jgi:hypothetical protein
MVLLAFIILALLHESTSPASTVCKYPGNLACENIYGFTNACLNSFFFPPLLNFLFRKPLIAELDRAELR